MGELLTAACNVQTGLNYLEKAIHRSFTKPDQLDKNLRLLNMSEEKLVGFPFLKAACKQTVIRNWLDVQISERDVHDWFKRQHKDLLPTGYTLATRKNHKEHIPDFWVQKNGCFEPVEIKLHEFGERHLKQLLRYMDFYDCGRGIAVASVLRCELPDSIRFIKFDPVEIRR